MTNQLLKANGKLLLTGEYFILAGAKGFALPTKFNQTLTVELSDQKGISWKSIDHENKVWFEVKFDEKLNIIHSTDKIIGEKLKNILSHLPLTTYNLRLTTTLNFPREWGLGSSSTLISLLAQYFKVDPYELLAKTFGGSGYDIACATSGSPLTYQLNEGPPIITPVDFHPSFSSHLYFVYLGKKQNSREGIEHYKNISENKSDAIEQVTDITNKLTIAKELDEFCYYLDVHENLVSRILNLPKVKDKYFDDFPGTVKSLGAWGGDFVMVASDESPELIERYFKEKGFDTILSYDAMIL
ncbi:MAG: hypothetical protein JWN78_2826 [Bacteroidota bacterium]|nr:hypothetical protein [Bacteroidota bacterium]